ncbi:MAG: hypothetical protein JWL60_754 [Gemmatimonadetes bacterium]|jgi:hypothetical protein|nr:hypothetical protein [Gemmatimonadota bacterium]
MPALRRRGTPSPEADRLAMLALVRSTGAQGGRIDPHRSIATIDLPRHDVVLAALLSVVLVATYVAGVDLLAALWTRLFLALAGPLGLGGVGQRAASVAGVAITMPCFTAHAPTPGAAAWWVTLVVTVLTLAGTLFLRGAWLPLAYALRFAAAIQASALLFFGLVPDRFPHDLGGYVSGMMLVGAVLIGIVPIVFGLTYFLMDVGWSRKVALALLVMAHLAVLVPLQYALHAAVIAHASLIVLPLCFILFGLLPEIMVLVALFGWGMSWQPLRARGRRQ